MSSESEDDDEDVVRFALVTAEYKTLMAVIHGKSQTVDLLRTGQGPENPGESFDNIHNNRSHAPGPVVHHAAAKIRHAVPCCGETFQEARWRTR